jgi:hypothetical protein
MFCCEPPARLAHDTPIRAREINHLLSMAQFSYR